MFDLCVVGGGPAGLAVALEAAELGLKVVLLEAGPAEAGTSTHGTEIVNSARHSVLSNAVASGLGGTSQIWGGRCVAFDPVDFAARSYVPSSDWPISLEEVESYYPKAAQLLGCGHPQFIAEADGWFPPAARISIRNLERWVPTINTAEVNRARIAAALNLTILQRHKVVALCFLESRLDAVEATVGGNRSRIRARSFVLACGGIGTTRILLGHQCHVPGAFGGEAGPLGRYYMGHISGKIASVVFSSPRDMAALDFFQGSDRIYVRRRITLNANVQMKERLLNAAFWLDNPPFYDSRHDSPILSSVFLALTSPVLGQRILPEAIRLIHAGPPPYAYGAHLLNVIRAPHKAFQGALEIVRDRYLAAVRKPGFLVRNDVGRYALHYHAEHLPLRDSRISMIGADAGDGLPRISVDLRYDRADAESVVRSHQIIDADLCRFGRGTLEYWHPVEERVDRVLDQACDGFHQVGTTRMSRDPRAGVVDENLRVHGTSNLFVASSSVFPTTGQANPTFLTVALGVRLAQHVARELSAA